MRKLIIFSFMFFLIPGPSTMAQSLDSCTLKVRGLMYVVIEELNNSLDLRLDSVLEHHYDLSVALWDSSTTAIATYYYGRDSLRISYRVCEDIDSLVNFRSLFFGQFDDEERIGSTFWHSVCVHEGFHALYDLYARFIVGDIGWHSEEDSDPILLILGGFVTEGFARVIQYRRHGMELGECDLDVTPIDLLRSERPLKEVIYGGGAWLIDQLLERGSVREVLEYVIQNPLIDPGEQTYKSYFTGYIEGFKKR